MGDMLTLIEKAQSAYTEDEARKFQEKMRKQSFTLSDYLDQFDKLKKMGNLTEMLGMVPGLSSKLKGNDLSVDEDRIKLMKAIILSITQAERDIPDMLKGSRKKRIALGSGTTIQEVNQLIKQYETSKEMMKRMTRGGKRIPNLF